MATDVVIASVAALAQEIAARGGGPVSGFANVPFQVARSELYTYEELTSPVEMGGATVTLDDGIGSWFHGIRPSNVYETLVRAVHDATIDVTVARFVASRRVVGVMGGHGVSRDAPVYRRVADLGRALTRAGFCVATGGGPGMMEAANLGAWFGSFDEGELDAALRVLDRAPNYSDKPDEYRSAALEVRGRWPDGGVSLAVPTWAYLDEPTGAFATHIAKYFTNSIREDGLLKIARSGVVYAEGGPGTSQEIFTDAAQNSLTLYEVRSPMVFFGPAYLNEQQDLVDAVRRQAREFGWADLIEVCDEVTDVVAFVEAHDPDRSGSSEPEPRRRRRRP